MQFPPFPFITHSSAQKSSFALQIEDTLLRGRPTGIPGPNKPVCQHQTHTHLARPPPPPRHKNCTGTITSVERHAVRQDDVRRKKSERGTALEEEGWCHPHRPKERRPAKALGRTPGAHDVGDEATVSGRTLMTDDDVCAMPVHSHASAPWHSQPWSALLRSLAVFDEADVGGVLAEAAAAEVEAVLADQTAAAVAHAAAGGTQAESVRI